MIYLLRLQIQVLGQIAYTLIFKTQVTLTLFFNSVTWGLSNGHALNDVISVYFSKILSPSIPILFKSIGDTETDLMILERSPKTTIKQTREKFSCSTTWFSPKFVSVWEKVSVSKYQNFKQKTIAGISNIL